MGLDLIIGLIIGSGLILAGYFVGTKKTFAFLAGFGETWQPVNQDSLGNRIGVLLILLGVIAIFASIFTIWFGATAGKISGVLAIIDVILVGIVIVLDQIGH